MTYCIFSANGTLISYTIWAVLDKENDLGWPCEEKQDKQDPKRFFELFVFGTTDITGKGRAVTKKSQSGEIHHHAAFMR